MKIEVSEIVGEYAIGVEDGKKLYEFICFHLSSGQEIELDFKFTNEQIQILQDSNFEKITEIVYQPQAVFK